MGETDYNALLYDKMKAEQDKYRDWLLNQPPEEILNHTYEYTMREDIVMCMEELELSPKQAKALLRSPCPLDDVYKEFRDRESCGFFESIPLWAVTLIGGLFITVLSFIMIMTVYGRFFKLYMYTALAPIPLSTFAGEPSQNVGKSFIKSYCAVLLEGAVIVLACIIFSLFASTPPVVNPDAAAVTQVWAYIGELVFNMLVLVGAVKMSDRIIREMMGL